MIKFICPFLCCYCVSCIFWYTGTFGIVFCSSKLTFCKHRSTLISISCIAVVVSSAHKKELEKLFTFSGAQELSTPA